MRFLLHFCCMSIVWGIAFAGCGLKHNEKMPQDAIHLQAKTDAESDAKRDVSELAYFGAGMSAPFAAGMCSLITGWASILIVANEGSYKNVGNLDPYFSITVSAVVFAGVLSIEIAHQSCPPNPPPERLIGKSPEYVKFYADAYRSKMQSYRKRAVAAGAIVGCTTMTVITSLLYALYDGLRTQGGPDVPR